MMNKKLLFAVFLFLLSSQIYSQTVKIQRFAVDINLHTQSDLYYKIAEVKVAGMGSAPYELKISTFNNGSLSDNKGKIPYTLYFTDDFSCQVASCASELMMPMGSIYSPIKSNKVSLYVLLEAKNIKGAYAGQYTDNFIVQLTAL